LAILTRIERVQPHFMQEALASKSMMAVVGISAESKRFLVDLLALGKIQIQSLHATSLI
jgi:hypothetical protein